RLALEQARHVRCCTLQDWDSELVDVSPTEDKLAYVVKEGGNLRLLLRDLSGEEEEIPPTQGLVRAAKFSPDGKRLAIIHASGDSPHDIWVYDIKARTLTQITDSLVCGLNRENFVSPQPVVYPPFDQT